MPSGVYKRDYNKIYTKERNKKISIIRKARKEKLGYLNSSETRKKMSETRKGRKVSEKTKKKMSETHKRIGTGKWMKGRKLSEETKKKLSERMKGNNYCLGKKHSEKANREKSERQKGENSHFWKGGITKFEIYRHYKNVEYKIWRNKVFERDNFTCLNCGVNGVYLHPHHIKSYTYYPELRYEVDNGITLCVPCHHQLHFGN